MKHLRLKLFLFPALLSFLPGGGLSVFAQTADGPVLADTVVTYGTRGEKIVEYIMLPASLVQSDESSLVSTYPLKTARGNILVRKDISGGIITGFTARYPDGSTVVFSGSTTQSLATYPATQMTDRFGNRIVISKELFILKYTRLFLRSLKECQSRITYPSIATCNPISR